MKRLTACIMLTWLTSAQADFTPEKIGLIQTLPSPYPDHWVMVHDFSFFHMFEGEVLVVDPLAEKMNAQYKGMMTASMIAAFETSRKNAEHYVIETFYSRGARGGERTDVVTIYDPVTLGVIDEIEIPAKRISGMPKTTATALLDNDRFLAVYNFTPGQSVSVVDLKNRQFVGEVATGGCGFVLPTGKRGFTSTCANGSFMTSRLDKLGKLEGTSKTDVVFDPENDPIFESPAVVKGVAYFPKFSGRIMPVDVSGKAPKVMDDWWVSGEDERDWRPGGMNVITADSAGVGYLLMHAEGGEGTHKNGGSEVWVLDLKNKKRTARMELANWGISLGTTGDGDNRLLLVTNADMAVDVYRLSDLSFVHTLNTGAATPFLVHGAN